MLYDMNCKFTFIGIMIKLIILGRISRESVRLLDGHGGRSESSIGKSSISGLEKYRTNFLRKVEVKTVFRKIQKTRIIYFHYRFKCF